MNSGTPILLRYEDDKSKFKRRKIIDIEMA